MVTTQLLRSLRRALARAAIWLSALALALVVLHAALTIALRISFPFQIEWSEGTSFLQGVVLRDSGVLYPDPHEAEFVPHVYTPLHAGAVAALSSVAGDHLPAGRALSVAATLATAAVLFRWSRRLNAGVPGALAGALWFLACFRPTGQWFDLVRVDMVFLVPFALALEALFRAEGPRPGAGAAWLALAYLAKQTALFYAPPLVVLVLWRGGRRAALRFVLVFVALAGAALAALHVHSAGWSTFYLFEAVRRHPLEQVPLRRSVEVAVWCLPVLLAWAVRRDRETLDLVLLALVSAVLSGLAFAKHGGYENAWLPLVVGTAPSAALLVSRAPAIGWILLAGAALFLHERWGGIADPVGEARALVLRSERDKTALERAVAHVASIPGRVFSPDDPWIAFRAGKGIQPLMHLVNELGIDGLLPRPIVRGITGADGGGFTAIVFAENSLEHPGKDSLEVHERRFQELVRHHFAPAERIPYENDAVGLTRFGLVIRPGRVYRRVPR